MIYLYTDEAIMHFLSPILIKYFLKNIPKEAFISNFQLSKIFVEA